jgi:hypothetical protein
MFEWSVSVGSVLTVLAIIFSGVAFYVKQERDSVQFKEDIHDIKIDLKQLNKIIMDLALQTQRLDMLEKIVFELRHNKGFVSNGHIL